MQLRAADLDADPVARGLVLRQWIEICERYASPTPCGEEEAMPSGSFRAPTGSFLVGEIEGAPVACGGVRTCQEAVPGVGEIKRMYVDPAWRGHGLGRVLLVALEEEACRLGYERLWLETGTAQPEARRLYESAGFISIATYGEYRHEVGTRCYEKWLRARVPDRSKGPDSRTSSGPSAQA